MILAALLRFGCGASGTEADRRETVTMSRQIQERMLFDFSIPEAIEGWSAVNDTVMGGVSQSRLAPAEEDSAAFQGVISLENFGGFATVRCPVGEYDLGGHKGIAVRVRGDGKRYKLFVKTNQPDDGYQYQADFATEDGAWQTINVPFEDFRARYRGGSMPLWPRLNPAKIKSLGFMIADKQAGPFRLEIAWLKAY